MIFLLALFQARMAEYNNDSMQATKTRVGAFFVAGALPANVSFNSAVVELAKRLIM